MTQDILETCFKLWANGHHLSPSWRSFLRKLRTSYIGNAFSRLSLVSTEIAREWKIFSVFCSRSTWSNDSTMSSLTPKFFLSRLLIFDNVSVDWIFSYSLPIKWVRLDVAFKLNVQTWFECLQIKLTTVFVVYDQWTSIAYNWYPFRTNQTMAMSPNETPMYRHCLTKFYVGYQKIINRFEKSVFNIHIGFCWILTEYFQWYVLEQRKER